MMKGINPLAALIAAIFIITLGWLVDFHPFAFVLLALMCGAVLTYEDDEQDFLYVKRELELKDAELNAIKKLQYDANQKYSYDLDDDFVIILRLAAIADKRKLGLFDKAELHKLLEKYDAQIEKKLIKRFKPIK